MHTTLKSKPTILLFHNVGFQDLSFCTALTPGDCRQILQSYSLHLQHLSMRYHKMAVNHNLGARSALRGPQQTLQELSKFSCLFLLPTQPVGAEAVIHSGFIHQGNRWKNTHHCSKK